MDVPGVDVPGVDVPGVAPNAPSPKGEPPGGGGLNAGISNDGSSNGDGPNRARAAAAAPFEPVPPPIPDSGPGDPLGPVMGTLAMGTLHPCFRGPWG